MLIEIRYPDTIIAFNKFAFFKLDELLMNLRIINKFRFWNQSQFAISAKIYHYRMKLIFESAFPRISAPFK